jgi:hypothetical protein
MPLPAQGTLTVPDKQQFNMSPLKMDQDLQAISSFPLLPLLLNIF